MGAFWNPQTDQMRWFMEQRGYLAMRVMNDWLFVKRDSEYAEGAVEIVRNTRRRLARSGSRTSPEPGALEKFYDAFND